MSNRRFTESRRIARILVIWTAYSIEINEENELFEKYLSELQLSWMNNELGGRKKKIEPDSKLLDKLSKFAYSDLEKIDKHIIAHLSADWTLEALPVTMRAILRIGIFELMNNISPPKVVINEYTTIASAFFSEAETGFVNAILEKLAFEFGQLEK